jgi:hypothetical protein
MHRVNGPGATIDNKFTEGDAGTGVAPTTVPAAWLTAVQEEIAGVIEGLGGTLSEADNAQLLDALKGARSLTTSGYQKLPGGLIIPWGGVSVAASATSGSATYPLAVPTTALVSVAGRQGATAPQSGDYVVTLPSATGITLTPQATYAGGARGYIFIVIGN